MQYIETTVTICSCDYPQAVELVSDIFYELGIKGVIVGDQDSRLPDVPPDNTGDRRHQSGLRPHTVTGYFEKNDQADHRLQLLGRYLKRLEKNDRILTTVTCHPVDEENWSESWKAFFEPIRISRRLVVKPSWRSYAAQKDEFVMELDPGMAFGTGSHPTTFLCLQMIEKYLKQGDAFLDVGTGSGILMIAAAGLGAKRITGIDIDPVAVDVARGNLSKNGITKNCRIIAGNLANAVHDPYDLVAANILAEVILELLEDIRRVTKPGGFFIASGIIDERQRGVVEKMESVGFAVMEIVTSDEWVAVAGQLK